MRGGCIRRLRLLFLARFPDFFDPIVLFPRPFTRAKQGIFVRMFLNTIGIRLVTRSSARTWEGTRDIACVAGGILERASVRAAIFSPWRSPRGNSRAAKPRVKFNSTLHQSSHGFATRALQQKHSRAKSRQLCRLRVTSLRIYVGGGGEGGGALLPYKRLLGMCRWMGSHFHDWIDYNGVAFLVELLDWGQTFSGFLG